jgi:hypothetical protein
VLKEFFTTNFIKALALEELAGKLGRLSRDNLIASIS